MASLTDVLVVGAGPAGTAAAITAARAGLDVTVIDKATFPRPKCCGDGLTSLALRELERLGFHPKLVDSFTPVDAAWVRSPSGREVCFDLPPASRGMFAAVAPRLELDHALVELARDAGAVVHEGRAIRTLDRADDTIVVNEGEFRCRYLVAADGVWSPTRKLVAPEPQRYLGEWHAFRAYATNVTGHGAKRLWVWFDRELLPGYAWSFPLPDGRVNLGFGVLRSQAWTGQAMHRAWDELVHRPHVMAALGPDAVMEAPKAWPIPARITTATLHRDRVLFVGDAARAADALTGEGIGQALLTGRLAADAIIGAPAQTGATYAHACRRELAADHRMSVALGQILRSSLGARGAMRVAGATSWTRRNFARWLFEDEARAVIATPRRWHKRFLDRDGAFS